MFIESLPEGLDTVIGSQGMGLFGGQIPDVFNTIALKRIYFRYPVMEKDIFENFDLTTEKDAITGSSNIPEDKTVIVAAHRESSLKVCDRVVAVG